MNILTSFAIIEGARRIDNDSDDDNKKSKGKFWYVLGWILAVATPVCFTIGLVMDDKRINAYYTASMIMFFLFFVVVVIYKLKSR